MLNPHDGRNPITFPTRLPDPTALGRHSFGGSNDVVGQIYCCRAGFVDLGHLRDHIDLTYYYYWNLVKGGANRAGGEIRPYGIGQGRSSPGEVSIKQQIPAADIIDAARSMAFSQSVYYEIATYYDDGWGHHQSSFSPEDLVSNMLGTYVAGKALRATSDLFDTAATRELSQLMTLLVARPPSDARAAFEVIQRAHWVTSLDDRTDLSDTKYLKRRNFNYKPIVPCLVLGAPACAGATFPSDVIPTDFEQRIKNYYDARYQVPGSVIDALGFGKYLGLGQFDAAITKIKAAAAARYPGSVTEGCGV